MNQRQGQVVLMVTLTLIPIFALLGLCVDLGWMQFVKKSAQKAADAAAVAAMLQFQSAAIGTSFACGVNGVVCQAPTSCNPSPSNYLNSGCLYAQQNGFSAAGNQNVTIAAGVGGPPPTAPGVNSSAYWITVRATQSVPALFSAVLGNLSGEVAARATAALTPSNDCIWIMDPTGSGALSMSGTPGLISACGVYINSSHATALSGNGTPTLHASNIDIVGSYSFPGYPNLQPDPPSTGVVRMGDPFANLAPPSATGLTVQSTSQFTVAGWDTVTLQPGIYIGGIYVKNGTAILSPGTYIIKGEGLGTQNANSTIQGTGVTIYNTCSTPGSCPVASDYSPFYIKATAHVSLTAPTSGAYAGLLIMEDRSIPAGHYSDEFGGGSSAEYTGIVYGPKSAMTFYGNSSLTAYTIIVCYRLQMVGTTDINNDYSELPSGNPIKMLALVE